MKQGKGQGELGGEEISKRLLGPVGVWLEEASSLACRCHSGWMLVRVVLGTLCVEVFREEDAAGLELQRCPNPVHAP